MYYKGLLLDQFQEDAISAIEEGNSVVVSAPTGAGKTLIAEYLIEKFLREKKRIIYTAPIKALSNQKYRDFKQNYGNDVGILTGDVAINERAPVLIMTTEIFRNMLFNDLEALSGVVYVVFDEIHYINDIERGVIWEESVIFAPSEMRFLALSATIPNSDSLGGWISTIKSHPVKVINHHHRPVPLKQLVYEEKNGLIPLEDFKKTIDRFNSQKKESPRPYPFSYYKELLKQLEQRNLLPALFFIFSREATFNFGWEAYRSFSFTTSSEREEIYKIFDSVVGDESLLKIESIQKMRRLTGEGIGIHNAGLLPILKEAVEVLFSRRLLKLLFVTETFALGINMPAKTVIFHSLEKYDGISFRYLMSREFYQMAGRAGRRGIDQSGISISIIPKNLEAKEFLRITDEKLELLESQFRLSYNTILNMLDSHQQDEIIQIINMSFHQYQTGTERSRKENEILNLRNSLKKKENLFSDCQDWTEIRKFIKSKEKLDYLRNYQRSLEKQLKKIKIHRLRKKTLSELNWVREHVELQQNSHEKLKCSSCSHVTDCLNSYRSIKKEIREINYLEKTVREIHSIDQVKIYFQKKKLLEELGYLHENRLTARGETGCLIYGYELIITELLFEAVFEISPEKLINMILAGVIYETPKRTVLPQYRPESSEFRNILQKARKCAHKIRTMEQLFLGDKITPVINTEIMPLVEMWCDGHEFSEITAAYPMEEGDIIRIFRSVIDLLRQLFRVTRNYEALNHKLHQCMEMMDRDIVSLSYYLKEENQN